MSNRTAVITGAARRIGSAITCELHQLGLDVIVHYHHSAAAAQALVEKLNTRRSGSAHAMAADLGSTDACLALIKKAHAVNNRLDVLVNNASELGSIGPLMEFDVTRFGRVFPVNAGAPIALESRMFRHRTSILVTPEWCPTC